MADRLAGSTRLRVVVERADSPRCSLRVGDCFEVDASLLTTPDGPFCAYAMAAVLPVLGMRQHDLPGDDWLARKPFVSCPDAADGVVMRIEACT